MRRTAGLLPLAFILFGVHWGAWLAALPDLAAHYELSSGPLGAMITAGFAVALPVMLASGRLLDRLGAAWGIGVPAVLMASGLALVATLPPIPLLVAGIVLITAGSGAYDVGINGAAMGHASWGGSARLTLLHASFSAGGVVGALGAGSALGAGVAFPIVYLGLIVALSVAAIVAARGRWEVAASVGAVPRGVAMAVLPLALLAAVGLLASGSLETWSAIYLRDVLAAGAFVGALGPAAFHTAMLTGRLIGAGVAGVLGGAATLTVAGLATMAGMGVALTASTPSVAVPGMALAALGTSFLVPVILSLAARRAGHHAGRAASYVVSMGYTGLLVAPTVVGFVSEAAGLRTGLLVIPIAGLAIVAASRTRSIRA
jgi:fucose permease